MKKVTSHVLWSLALTCYSHQAVSAKLNVPGDFPNSFYMELLAGNVFVNAGGSFELFPNGESSRINFDATAFDGIGIGEGTSNLTLTSTDDWKVSDFYFFQNYGSIYIDGNGSGTLIDNGDGTGEWSLELPMYMLWSDIRIDFDGFSLSSSATYQVETQHGSPIYDPVTDSYISSISGSSMSYETGDTFLVGQATVDPNHPYFAGITITMGVYGNDPILEPVPVPAAVWLFGSGLICLAAFARRKRF